MNGAKNKMTFLIESRQWLPYTLFTESISWLHKQNKLSIAFHSPFPSSLIELGAYLPHRPVSLKRELEWSKSLINVYNKQIQEYIFLRKKVQELTLLGNFSNAIDTLTLIQKQFGFSFWWIKYSLALHQLNKGIESQKKLANNFKNQFASQSASRYIIHQLSILNEPSVTPSRFVDEIKEEISGFSLTNDWKLKLIYHITGEAQQTLEDALQILRLSTADSLIDTYEAFINISQVAFITEISNQDKQVLLNSLLNINLSIKDPRIDSLLFALSLGEIGKPEIKYLQNSSRQLVKDNNSAVNERTIIFQPCVGNLISASLENLNKPGKDLYTRLSSYLSAVLFKTKDADLSATEIDRIALMLPGLEVASLVRAIAKYELQPEPAGRQYIIKEIIENKTLFFKNQFNYTFSSALSFHPLILKYIPSDILTPLTLYALKESDISKSNFLCTTSEVDEQNVYQENENIYNRALFALNNESFDQCIELAQELIQSNTGYYEASGIKLLIYSLLKKGNFIESINTATKSYLKNPELAHILPIRELADRVDKQLRRDMKSDLSLTILFDIYTRTIDGAYESILRKSVSAALFGNGVTRPSELKDKEDEFDNAHLIYFLKYTCLPEIIYIAGDYTEGTSSLLEERIKILKWLIELDPSNLLEYDSEILDYTRKIVLQTRRVEVEQSKIEYNLEGLIRAAEKTVKENYERYIAYINAGIENNPNGEPLQRSSKASIPLIPISIPINEVSELLKSIAIDLMDIFVKDRNYGMDGFLATRIRHNELESEMLSSVIALKLVTTRTLEGKYKFNEYWLNEIKTQMPDKADNLHLHLSEFAYSYDNLIKEINEQWVRIRRDSNDYGLIEISNNSIDYDNLVTIINDRKLTFIDLCSLLFHTFFTILEIGLNTIRQKLNNEAKSRAITLVDTLELQVLNTDFHNTTLLNSVRELRVTIPRSIDKIISWLKPSKENSNEPLRFDYIIQIAIDMAKHYNPGFSAELHLDETEGCHVEGIYVNACTIIFMILFQNTIRRAGLGHHPSVVVKCNVIDDNIRCCVINRIGQEIDINQTIKKVNCVMESCADESYREKARGESGTGLYRIYDAIKNVIKCEPNLNIIVTNDRTFEVSFQLPQAKQ
ncbi:hypothetical protein SAMN00120144_4115 [Hymenobacter roseosalivarius DSM 11622]|uniref:Uncharacterized protein n=2 Tax=Hymenobacter roseosalivarius TaxID=89967 RepID=A0A1W1UET5_9BACT|nr:hypothetical protein SAMN00120144_4115 [Hymenobacter roseosalivarius DSM 11622]